MARKMFRERNPIPLGSIVVVWLVASLACVLNIDAIVAMYGRNYTVELPEAAGLKQGDPVRVSGLDVGRVGTVGLGRKYVVVEFSVTDTDISLGSQTTAEVSVETVLGDKALVLTSAGDGELASGATIPVERVSVPYDVTDALTDLHGEAEAIDIDNVATALTTVAETVEGAGPELEGTVKGLGRLSALVSGRDEELRRLLTHADDFSGILADRSKDVKALMKDGNLLFAELLKRRRDVSALLVNVSRMSRQLTGLVKDNDQTLGPALKQLNQVLTVLRGKKQNIEQILDGFAGYAIGLGEVVASGPFFTAYLQNVLPGNLIPPKVDLAGRTDPTAAGGGQ